MSDSESKSMGPRQDIDADDLLARPGFIEGYRASLRSQDIGAEVAALRTKRGWSQAELASRCGMDQRDLSRLESGKWGKGGIDLATLERVVGAMGARVMLHVDETLEGELERTADVDRTQALVTRVLWHDTRGP